MKKILILFGILLLISCVTSYAIPTHVQQDNFRIASVKDFSGIEIDTVQCLGNCEALFKVDNYEAVTASRASIFKFDFSNPDVKVSDVRVYRDVPYTAYDVTTKQEERTCAKSLNGSYCQNDCKDGAVISSVCHYNVTVTTTKPRVAQRKEWVSLGYATKSGVVAIPKSSTEWVKVLFSVPIGSSGKFNLTLGYGAKQIVLDPWWNSSFLYKRPIVITENATLARINDKIHVTFPAAAKAKSQGDCDDIRVVCGEDSTPYEVPRYIDYCPAGASDVEVQFALNVSAGSYNDSCSFYYGAAGVSAPSYTAPVWSESAVQYVVNGTTKGYCEAYGFGHIEHAVEDSFSPVCALTHDRWDVGGTLPNASGHWGVIDFVNPKFEIYNLSWNTYNCSQLYQAAVFDIACGNGGNGTDATTSWTTIYNSTSHVGDGYIYNMTVNVTADNQSTCQFLRLGVRNATNGGNRFMISRFYVYGHASYNYTIGAEEVPGISQNSTVLSVNITPSTPSMLNSLNCSATLNTDIYGSQLANFTWFTNSVHNATWNDLGLNFTNMTARGSATEVTGLYVGDTWVCEVSFYNNANSSWTRVNSSSVTINGTEPVIYSPANGSTNVSDNISVSFTADTGYTSAEFNTSIDGVLVNTTTLSDGENYTVNITGLSEGAHTINITTNISSTVITVVVLYSNVTNVSWQGSVYELSIQDFNISINAVYPVLNVTLNFTGLSNYTVSNYSSNNWSYSMIEPLVIVATEYHNFSWSYVLNVSGTYQTNSSSNYTQAINNAFTLTSIRVNQTDIIEGNSFNFTMVMTNYSAGGFVIMYGQYDGTNHTVGFRNHSDSATEYSIIFNTSTVTSNVGVNISSFGNVSYMNRSKIISITNVSVIIYNIVVGIDCVTGVPVMIFKAWDEEANHSHLGSFNTSYGNVTVTWDWKIDVWVNLDVISTYSNTTSQLDNLTICISPANATVKVNVSMFVNMVNYSQREFHFINYTVSGGTLINYSVYMVNESKTYLIDIYVEDEYNQDMEDVVVYVKRFFYDETNDTIVASMVTDTLGHVASYLVWQDVKYSFLIYQGGTLLKYIEPMFMTDPSVTFTMSPEISNILGYLAGIDSSCYYNNITKTVRCNVTDPSGQMTSARLVVKEFKWFGSNTICEDTQYGNDVALFCNMTGAAVSTEQYMWTVYVSGSIYPITSGLVVTVGTASFADIGIFVTIGMITIIGGLGMWHPMAAVVGAFVAVVFAAWINFINISVGALAGLAMVLLIYAFLARRS